MPVAVPPRNYTFGRFELQQAEGRLLESGKPLAVSARALELLAALVERRGLTTKKELLKRVWPGVVVEENSLQAQISSLRKLLGSEAILTVSGQGYRFAMDVVASDVDAVERPREDNLPRYNTSLVGRVQESAEIRRLLSRSRLLTLVGTGGCGKTRLAVEIATEGRATTTRRICFVDLSALSDATHVAQRLAAALGVAEEPSEGLIQDIARHLESKPTLVILDGAELLLSACGRLVDELLTQSPSVSFLVTSRERLVVSGELTYRVPSLSIPDGAQSASPESLSGCESVELFVDRARILRPHFSVDASNATFLAEICSQLDGIPLAIELVAPHVRWMSLDEIARRLDRRFSLMKDGSERPIPRQRTLRSVIDWSFELLTPAEQAVFCRASVFSGAWDLESAESVCAGDGVDANDVLDVLASLVDKQLVTTEQTNNLTRYRMLATLRQYAQERLSEGLATFRSSNGSH